MGNDNQRGKFRSSIAAGAAETLMPQGQKRQPEVRIAKTTYASMLGGRVLRSLLAIIVLNILVYTVLAATIVRVIPSSELGFPPVKNITFEGGIIPDGELAVVDMEDEHGVHFTDRLKQAFVYNNQLAIVKTLKSPWGEFSVSDTGSVLIDGAEVPGVTMKKPKTELLADEYLVVCVKGSCKEGEAYVISSPQIIGVPLKGFINGNL